MNMKNGIRIIVAMLALGAVAVAGCSTSGATLETVSPQAAADVIASEPAPVVLDIRTPDEFSQGHLEGAVNIDFYEPTFASDLDALDKDAHYVVYCRSDNRSGQAMQTFEELGFTNVTEIDGGIVAWYDSGLPITQG
jgi:rhodanese-related sulfurtransferase